MSIERASVPRSSTYTDSDRADLFEVFFDLVFVFALTRVFSHHTDLRPESLLQGVVVLALLWWAWSAFIWLGNRVRLDQGWILGGTLIAMAALFVAALVIPEAWASATAGSAPAIALAVAFVVVRGSYLVMFLATATDDHRLRTQLLIDIAPQSLSIILLLVGAFIGGAAQLPLWAAAFAIDFGVGRLTSRFGGWQVLNPRHFVERYSLVLLIVLGETLLSLGQGLGAMPSSAGAISAGLMGFVITTALWWSYFGSLSEAAAEVLVAAGPRRRMELARDGYVLSQFLLVVGIAFESLGIAGLTGDVISSPGEPPSVLATLGSALGAAGYLLGIVVVGRVTLGTWDTPTIVGSIAIIAIGVSGSATPAWLFILLLCAAVVLTSVSGNIARRMARTSANRSSDGSRAGNGRLAPNAAARRHGRCGLRSAR